MRLLTQNDLTKIFNVNITAVNELVNTGKLPFKKTGGGNIFFCPDAILRHIVNPDTKDEKHLERFKKKLWEANPSAMRDIQEFGSRVTEPRAPKTFYLEKVKNKKKGFVWYVRYIDKGVVVPSHWSTGTNDRAAAERWAAENRGRLLAKYYNRGDVKKPYGEMYSVLRNYYSENSPYLETDRKRGKKLSGGTRVKYCNFITKQFIPWLQKNGVGRFEEIDTPMLTRFQNFLLDGGGVNAGIKPQSIKIYLLCVSQIFNHMVLGCHLETNPYKSMVKLRVFEEELRGCYEITELKGVFNKIWGNRYLYLLCLLVYTTGMRNSEIERMKAGDLFVTGNTRFINITESKTENGVRVVPLHDFVYRKLAAYIRKTGKGENDFIFKSAGRKKLGSGVYNAANTELAKYTGYSKERLEKENITFYSGRHFWKTLMDSEGLGEIEEYFMGHKISNDVAKRYNHKDKQGKKKLLERAGKVFRILDRYVFR